MKIYQISGMGANEKVYKNLRINPEFETIYIPWLQPEEDETLRHYAERMAETINPNQEFIVMGMSFGGIITKEINQFLNPRFNILISTIKNSSEKPSYMKLSSRTNIHRYIPPSLITSDSFLSYSIFRKLYSSKLPDLKEIFEFRDHYYLKWAADRIVNWESKNPMQNYVHIHGNKDIVFPISKINDAIEIQGGSHVMIMNHAKKISNIINENLEKL